MKLTDEQLAVIEIARATARMAVDASNMEQLDKIVETVYESGINVLLIFNSEEKFKRAINEQE